MKRNKQWNISKALALASSYHFLYCAAKGCIIPFLTIYLRQLGLSAPFVGIVIGTKFFISLICTPFWSYCAGRYNKRRMLVFCSLISSIGISFLFTLIPPVNKEIQYKYCNTSMYTKNNWNQNIAEDKSHMGDFANTMLPGTVNIVVTSHPRSELHNIHSTEMKMKLHLLTTVELPIRNSTKQPSENITTSEISIQPSEEVGSANNIDHLQAKQTLPLKGSSYKRTVEKTTKQFPLLKDNKEENGSLDVHLSTPNIPLVKRDVTLKTSSEDGNKNQQLNFAPNSNFKILDNWQQTLVLILLAVSLWEVLASALDWVTDDGLYDYLDFVDAVDRYGRQWVWGYLGTAGAAFSIGILVDRLDCLLNTHTSRNAVHFYAYAAVLLLALIVGVLHPVHTAKKNDAVNQTFKGLHLLGSDGRAILYAVTVLITGAIGSTINNFLFWQMQDKGSSEAYMGTAVAIGFLAEFSFFHFKDKMLNILSFSGTMGFALICLAAQLLYYSFLWSSWAVLPVQVLNAFSNSALWLAVLSQSSDIATPGTERTLHKIYHWISFGLGACSGSFCSGFIVNSFGIERLFQACSVTAIVWAVFFLIIQSKIPRQKRLNYSRLLADTSDLSDSDDEQNNDWLVKALKNDNFLMK
ncbi:major facilitator superfamily domain-containing protein 6-like [Hypanus sabinus]|uniref:major facilitator superfamily domain-containing protein 6-like n=1 Tax=Hypanus sabinus TaxID=79690 RepID=UPI0028C45D02|nr:major facilitator superfamily domain-containing protein 6-like [Hypanus sabinus]XP_059804699.1 major facilitator superfamily domain-containing protein 6-like [Hypanus sabinus]